LTGTVDASAGVTIATTGGVSPPPPPPAATTVIATTGEVVCVPKLSVAIAVRL